MAGREARKHLELRGWKAIAAHLECHIETAIKYANEEEMPVHKLGSSRSSIIFAYKDKIDEWWEKRLLKPRVPTPKKTRAA